MAVSEKVSGISMKIRGNGGTDPEGSPIVNVKTVSGINKAATAEQIVLSAKAVASLYTDTYEGVSKVTTAELVEG